MACRYTACQVDALMPSVIVCLFICQTFLLVEVVLAVDTLAGRVPAASIFCTFFKISFDFVKNLCIIVLYNGTYRNILYF